MSMVQRFFQRFLPAAAASMEAESRQWMIQCPNCKWEKSIWDIGGIRAGAGGNGRTYMRCPNCRKRGWHTIYKKENV